MNAQLLQPSFASALMAADPAPPPGLRGHEGSDAAARFAVYRNNVRSSLGNALADAFPVLLQLLGAETFRALALEYLRVSPPRSPVLLEYGADLGDFIAGFEPLGQWPYLADVARLEQLRVQSFHSADAAVLAVQAFQTWLARPEQLPGLRLVLHPSLRLLRSEFAVASLWNLHQQAAGAALEQDLAALDLGQGEDLAIWRPAQEVRLRVLPPGGYEALLALQAGHRLGEALEAASAIPGFELQSNFDLLVHDGLVHDIHS